MIATHNIKVNGRWIRAGEEYGEKKPQPVKSAEPEKKEQPVAEPEVPVVNEPETPVEETPKTEAKAKTSRRKTAK